MSRCSHSPPPPAFFNAVKREALRPRLWSPPRRAPIRLAARADAPADANAKIPSYDGQGDSAPLVTAAYARLLIVQPRQNTPEQLHDFLRDTPLAVPAFFKFVLTARRALTGLRAKIAAYRNAEAAGRTLSISPDRIHSTKIASNPSRTAIGLASSTSQTCSTILYPVSILTFPVSVSLAKCAISVTATSVSSCISIASRR